MEESGAAAARKVSFRPELGLASSGESPGPKAATPEGVGRALGYFETLCQFLSVEGTPPLHPSPAPHPVPRVSPSRAANSSPVPGAPGWGRGSSLPVCKVFQGFVLADY